MANSPDLRDLARRLLEAERRACERKHGETEALFHVFEQFRKALVVLAGVDGFRSLLARSLTLATRHVESLGSLQVESDGTLGNRIEDMPTSREERGGEGGIVLIAQFLGLLTTFIGHGLTMRLVHDIWPEDSLSDETTESGTNP